MNSDPAREVSECGVQLARGFPPWSKWTYGEVFHPAVIPQPPFNLAVVLDFFFSFYVLIVFQPITIQPATKSLSSIQSISKPTSYLILTMLYDF